MRTRSGRIHATAPAARSSDTSVFAAACTHCVPVVAVVHSLVGTGYALILGSLGRDETLGLPEPGPDTYEGFLQTRIPDRGLIAPTEIPTARTRADHRPEHGFFPLDRASIDGADAILHIHDGAGYRGAGEGEPRPWVPAGPA